MAVRWWQKSRQIYVRPRTGPQFAHLWWSSVAKLQAAGVPIAYAAAPWDRQTDGSRYSKMPPMAGGIINYYQLRVTDDEELCRVTLSVTM